MSDNTNSAPKGLKLWLMAARAYSFPASIIPVLLGSVLAVVINPDLKFSFLNFFLTLAGCVLVQVGTNLINDIFDYDKGIDKEDKESGIPHGGSMVLSMGLVTMEQMKKGAFITLLIALLIGIYLYTVAGIWILYLTVFGLMSAVFYTAKPLALKYKALGDLQVIISFGLGMTLGSYIVQTKTFSYLPLLFSIPVGLLIDAILHSNNIRDINYDGKFGVKTLPILLGEKLSIKIYDLLLIGAYISVIMFVALKMLPWFALLSLVTLPLALKLIKMLPGIPPDGQERFEYGTGHIILTAKLNMTFGLTLVLGLLLWYLFIA